jgi:hypothetical protein
MSSAAGLDPREVASREDLARFVAALRDEFLGQGNAWTNRSLDQYLDALAAWLQAASHWAANIRRFAPELVMDVEDPSWRLMAQALRAARSHE